MADHVVHRGADRLREAAVVERRRDRLELVDDEVVADPVELVRRDAGFDVRPDHVEHVGRQAAGDAHLLLFFRRLDRDGHVSGCRTAGKAEPRKRALAGWKRLRRRGSALLLQGRYGIKRAPQRQRSLEVKHHTRAVKPLTGCSGNGVVSGAAWRTNPKGEVPWPTSVMRRMLEAGVHFGHQTRFWNPEDVAVHLRRAQQDPHHQSRADGAAVQAGDRVRAQARGGRRHAAVRRQQARGARGDRDRSAALRHAVREPALARRHAHELQDDSPVDQAPAASSRSCTEADGSSTEFTKKEMLKLVREREKLERALGGIKQMDNLPDAVFIIDVGHEEIAVREASKLGMPVVAVVDTNCSPEGIEYPIPGNDDAMRAIQLYAEGDRGCRARRQGVDSRGADGRRRVRRARRGRQAEGRAEGGGEEGADEEAWTRHEDPLERSRAPAVGRQRAGPTSAPTPTGEAERARSQRPIRGDRQWTVKPALVKELRERTGAGMMDCKNALVDANGDLDAAAELLRKQGQAKADKKASRVAAEGRVVLKSDEARGPLRARRGQLRDRLRREGRQLPWLRRARRRRRARQASGERRGADGARDGGAHARGRSARSRHEGRREHQRAPLRASSRARATSAPTCTARGSACSSSSRAGRRSSRATWRCRSRRLRRATCRSDDVPKDVLAKEREIIVAQTAEEKKPPEILAKMVEGKLAQVRRRDHAHGPSRS